MDKIKESNEEKNFRLEDLKVTVALFNKLGNLTTTEKAKFNLYRALNEELILEYDGSLQSLLEKSTKKSGLKVRPDYLDAIVNFVRETRVANKLKITRDNILQDIKENISIDVKSQITIFDLLIEYLKQSLTDFEKIDIDFIRAEFKEEFARTITQEQEEETVEIPYYSEDIRDNFSAIMQIVEGMRQYPKYKEILSSSCIDAIIKQKELIGKAWIRKILSIPENSSIQDLTKIEGIIYGEDPGQNVKQKRILDEINEKEKNAVLEKKNNTKTYRGRIAKIDEPINIFAGNILHSCQRLENREPRSI